MKSFIKSKKVWITTIAVVLFIAGIFTAATVVGSYETRSVSKQLSLGEKYLSELDYTKAIIAFNKVIEIEPRNIEAYIGLAKSYKGLGQLDMSIDTLDTARQILLEEMTITGEVSNYSEELYMLIADIYEKSGDEESAYRMLKEGYELTNSKRIKNLLDNYYPVVEVSLPSGTYDSSQFVNLVCSSGIIHFTLDESEPTNASEIYLNPIQMNKGNTILKVVVENKFGDLGEVQTFTYNIEEQDILSETTDTPVIIEDERSFELIGTFIDNAENLPDGLDEEVYKGTSTYNSFGLYLISTEVVELYGEKYQINSLNIFHGNNEIINSNMLSYVGKKVKITGIILHVGEEPERGSVTDNVTGETREVLHYMLNGPLAIQADNIEILSEITPTFKPEPSTAPITNSNVDDVIEWNDNAFEKGIRGVLNKYEGEIYISDVIDMIELDLSSLSIKVIDDIINFPNLMKLNLSNNMISDISSLGNLKNLMELYLINNRLSDITAIEYLTNLTNLYLGDNMISDISALENLTNLETLTMWPNNIEDISALKNLTNLRTLEISGNIIKHIDDLQNLTNLEYLGLAYNQITDISILSNMTKLTYLDLRYNQIDDWSPVSDIAEVFGRTN